MVRLCIILSVFLITAIFGMADMEIRSQNAQAKINYGEWHVGIRDLSDEEAAIISQRPKVLACTRYDTLNYRLSMHYQVEGKEAVIIGFDEAALSIFPTAHLIEGSFPKEEGGVIVDQSMKKALSLELGDEISLLTPDGSQKIYHITGFFGQFPMLAKQDVYGLALKTEEFRKLSLEGAEDNHDSFAYIKLSPLCNMQKEIREIQEQFGISLERVTRNELLLATIGQSQDVSMMVIYVVAFVLAVLVAIAGILMITGSLNSNIAQRTEFFGMLCCLGASREQVIRFVRKEALYWCRSAVPAGTLLGTVVVWMLSALLRFLSPTYFGGMPYFGISVIGLIAGSAIGIITVLLAAGSPAKKAANVSPLTAVSGNAFWGTSKTQTSFTHITSKEISSERKKGVNTRFCRIETALGIHHALGSRKNFILMSCSFAFSIILFLSFSTAVDFMKHAVNPLKPYAPDLSIISPDNSCSIDRTLAEKLAEVDGVKRVYGRSFAYDLTIQTPDGARQAFLLSYEDCQFGWAEDSLISAGNQKDGVEASHGKMSRREKEQLLAEVMEGEGILAVYHGENSLAEGGDVLLNAGEGEKHLTVLGILSDCPFNSADGEEILICSEETFESLTGKRDYTIIDVQLERNADDQTVSEIRALSGENSSFSDSRLSNAEVRGAMYSFQLFVYGFLGVIALICAFHIINSIAMSVSARMREYGAMRAVGMEVGQCLKMVASEAAAYGMWGVLLGCAVGIPFNWFCFDKLVTFRWGTEWHFPVVPLYVIVAVVLCSLGLAVWEPAKRVGRMEIVDTILGM